jgi:hypothetical protein
VTILINLKRDSSQARMIDETDNGVHVCEQVLNEVRDVYIRFYDVFSPAKFTESVCISALADYSNVPGLFDEFDDDSQKITSLHRKTNSPI